jgi:hypothetical protein
MPIPARWNVAERMAAATFRLDRWEAGARLMQSANSQGWARGVSVSELERANRKALDDCRKAAVWTGMAQRCTVTVASGSAKSQSLILTSGVGRRPFDWLEQLGTAQLSIFDIQQGVYRRAGLAAKLREARAD